MLLAFDGTESIVADRHVEQARKDDHLTANLNAPLLEEESEGIACIEVKGIELHEAATLKKKLRVDLHLAPPVYNWYESW